MATNDIRFNQIGGGCGSSAGLYTAYAPEKGKEDLETDNFIGDWKNVIPVGSLVNVFTDTDGNGTGPGLYMVIYMEEAVNLVQIAARTRPAE